MVSTPEATSLEYLPVWEEWRECVLQGHEKPLITQVQLAGQPAVKSSQLPPPTI